MPYPKLSGAQQQGPQASGDAIDAPVSVSLAASTQSLTGQCYAIDQTNAVLPDSIGNAQIILQNPAIFLQKGPRVVLPTSANAAGIVGAQTNVTFTSASGSTTIVPLILRMWGHGPVQAGAASGGTVVNIGNQLSFSAFPSASQTFATAAANAAVVQGLYVGVAQAMYIQTQSAGTIASGSSVVTPNNVAPLTGMAGITETGTAVNLTIDVPSSGVQEVVAVTASGANSNTFTATYVNAHTGVTLITGVASTAGNRLIKVPGASTYSAMVYAFLNP